MRYIDELKTLPTDNADNALYLGTALHTGLEKGIDEAIKQYYSNYTVINDENINEAIKLEIMIAKAKKICPEGQFEVLIEDDDFKGFIDLLVPVRGFHDAEVPNVYDIYDFKYSNNVDGYMKSDQLHLYKYFFEKLNPDKQIRNLYFLFVPKAKVRKKRENESVMMYRKVIIEALKETEPFIREVQYDYQKVIDFLIDTKHTVEATDFTKNYTWLCNWCEFKDYCKEGKDYMLLPKNERRKIEEINKKVIWVYGAPFSGKTVFADKFPDPLMLNTDGNIKFVTAPYISIQDKIEKNGRMINRTLAWDIFKDVIMELEKKDNDFKTIVVDLLEDCYEYCRLYIYDQMGISHESDDSFRAWDKVTTEFLSVMRRFMNLDYENIILISHEDTSKDITKRGGDKITAIKPNLREKVANKVAGMVDIVARAIAEGDNYTLSFKKSEVIFGGGRLTINNREIPTSYEDFLSLYNEISVDGSVSKEVEEKPKSKRKRASKKDEETTTVTETPQAPEEIASVEKVEEVNEVVKETVPETEEKPKRRTRKRRTE